MTFFDSMVNSGFLTQSDRDHILFSDSLEEINVFIDHFEALSIIEYKKGS